VNLVQINVVHLEAAQRIFTPLDDVFTAQASSVRSRAHCPVHFGSEDDVVSRCHLVEPFASDFLADSGGVYIGGVKEVDARFKGDGEMFPGDVRTDGPFTPLAVAVAHAPHADA
jgi:hypothetical protein